MNHTCLECDRNAVVLIELPNATPITFCELHAPKRDDGAVRTPDDLIAYLWRYLEVEIGRELHVNATLESGEHMVLFQKRRENPRQVDISPSRKHDDVT